MTEEYFAQLLERRSRLGLAAEADRVEMNGGVGAGDDDVVAAA